MHPTRHTNRRDRGRAIVLAATVLAFSGVAAVAGQEDPLRLGDQVVPTFQAIRLDIDADREDYTGSVDIDLTVKEPTDTIRFHAEGIDLTRVELEGPAGIQSLEHGTGEIGLVTAKAPEPLAPGKYRLSMDFKRPFETKGVGLYRMIADDRGYLFTQMEAEDARKAFPCWDEPGFKLPYQMTITAPAKHLVLSNTPILSETTQGGKRTTVFAKTRPLPSYLLAIASGPLETVPIPDLGVPGRVVVPHGRKALTRDAVAFTPPILRAMEDYFGSGYPFEKLDLIAIPEYWYGAMENPGAITFADGILLLNPGTATVTERRRLARVIAHEIAHMWFGDVVTMQWWDDLWLNESFADWLGDKVTHEVYPEFDTDLTEMSGIQSVMDQDARPSTPAIRRPFAAADNKFQGVGLAYNKGKSVLSMFERWIGPDAFRKGMLAYMESNAWSNAEADDLWRALATASGKDLVGAMQTFLTQSGVPLVSVEPLEGGRVRLTQRRFLNAGTEAEPRQWRIPITLRYPAGDLTQTTTTLLAQPESVIDLPVEETPAWIHPDAEAMGYYRWTVPSEMLMEMALHADSLLSDRERIAFVGNLTALLRSDVVDGGEFLGALQSFAKDPEPQVVSAVLDALEDVELAFVTPELEAPFAHYVRETLAPAMGRFGLEKRAGESDAVAVLRPRLVSWLGDQGQSGEIRAMASRLAKDYMKDPSSIDPELASVALRLAAIEGDENLFDEFRRRVESASTPAERRRYLRACGAFRDPGTRGKALAMLLNESIRPNEMSQLARFMADTPAGREQRYRYMVENFEALRDRLPGHLHAGMVFYAGGCEKDRIDKAKAFFSEPGHTAAGVDNTIERVADQVLECVGLRERELSSVSEYLSRLAGGM